MTQAGSSGFLLSHFGAMRLKLLCGSCTVLCVLWPFDTNAQIFGRFFWGAPAPAPVEVAAPPVPVVPPRKTFVVRKPRVVDLAEVRRNDSKVRELMVVAKDVSVEAALQLDQTLRFGDIAVLSSGLHIFRGKSAAFHREGDFLPLAQSNLKRRADLSAIQKTGTYQQASHGGFIAITTVRPIGRFSEIRAKTSGGFKTISVGSP